MEPELFVFAVDHRTVAVGIACRDCSSLNRHEHWWVRRIRRPAWFLRLFGVTWEHRVITAKRAARKRLFGAIEAEKVVLMTGGEL